jgi:lysophospholipase L1-like esterase
MLEAIIVLGDVRPAGPSHLSNRRVTMALDCYPSNPRGYFDVDLRSPGTLERYRAHRVRRIEEQAPIAPFAVELVYNAQQFRDRDFGRRRPGRRRIIVLGDSFTEGQGVRAADVYPRLLERHLEEAEPGRWEVLNAGRRGADFPALSETFEELLAFDPDLVVYALMLNDAVVTDGFRARHAFVYDRIARGWGRPPRSLLRMASFVGARLDAWRVEDATVRWYREMYGPYNREGWDETAARILEMDRRMRARGGRLLVAIWPVLAGLEGDYLFAAAHRMIAELCGRAGIPVHDLLSVLSGRPSATLWVHAVDRHPNEVAHRLAGKSLASFVSRLGRP